jgi:PhnB protein
MAKKVRPVPKGYHAVTPGLAVRGADKFIAFCRKGFGAKEVMRMPGPGGAVMHAELLIGDSRIMVGDEIPGMSNKSAAALGGSPVTFFVYVEKCDAVFKKAVAAGATVRMPMENMFWGDRMGQVMDPFGNTWAIASRIEDLSPREMKKRGEAWMKQMAQQAPGA